VSNPIRIAFAGRESQKYIDNGRSVQTKKPEPIGSGDNPNQTLLVK